MSARTMDITRGSLDDITRPARGYRHRPGSRVSLSSGLSSPINRPPSQTSSSFEVLPPDPDIFLQEENDLAIEEYLSSSEDTESKDVDSAEDEEDADHSDKDSQDRGAVRNSGGGALDRMRNLDLLIAKTDIVPMGGNDDDDDIVSDSTFEEPQQAGCGSSQQSPHSPTTRTMDSSSGQHEEHDDPDADLDAILDPELRKAMKKMRRLDRILTKTVTREKEVKRQRKMLHHQLEQELESIKEEGGGKSKEVMENTSRFLALVPPVSHDEGVDVSDIPSTPVFATQPPERDQSRRASTTSSCAQSSPGRRPGRSKRNDQKSVKTSPRDVKYKRKPRPPGAHGTNEDGADFIQRNIDLACDAGNLIAMTDDEKKRLEDLLQDVEMLAEETEQPSPANLLQLNRAPGIGYQPDLDNQKLLQDIDEKLKSLLPSDDFDDICSTPSLIGDRESFNPEAFLLGERVLQDTKDARSQQERLQNIEKELAHLQTQVENEISSPSLSKMQLNCLLQKCTEASNRATTEITSPRSPRFASVSTSSHMASASLALEVGGESPPADERIPNKLTDDVLQQLLSEAKTSLGLLALENGSRTSSRNGVDASPRRESMQLTASLDESPRSEMSTVYSARSLVSHDVIQQLLRNPRATMLQSTRLEPASHDNETERDMEADDELNASVDR